MGARQVAMVTEWGLGGQRALAHASAADQLRDLGQVTPIFWA